MPASCRDQKHRDAGLQVDIGMQIDPSGQRRLEAEQRTRDSPYSTKHRYSLALDSQCLDSDSSSWLGEQDSAPRLPPSALYDQYIG